MAALMLSKDADRTVDTALWLISRLSQLCKQRRTLIGIALHTVATLRVREGSLSAATASATPRTAGLPEMDVLMPTTREDELKEAAAQGPSKRPSKEQARQGQNIRGMVTVLIVSILLVVGGFIAAAIFSRPAEPAATNAPPATQTTPASRPN